MKFKFLETVVARMSGKPSTVDTLRDIISDVLSNDVMPQSYQDYEDDFQQLSKTFSVDYESIKEFMPVLKQYYRPYLTGKKS